MKDDIFVENFFSAYDEKRKEHLDSRWLKFRSYFFRIFRPTTEYSLLLLSEKSFQEEMLEWLSGIIKIKGLTTQDIEKINYYIKGCKIRLESRNIFLVLFAGSLGVSALLYGALDSLTNNSYAKQILLVNSIFLILELMERYTVTKYKGLAEEFSNLLELWLKVKSQAAGQ